MNRLIIIVVAISILGAGCIANQDTEQVTEIRSTDDSWTLRGEDLETLSSEIAEWATHTFSRKTRKTLFGSARNESTTPSGELRLIASHRANVVDIPSGRKIGEYAEPVEPSHFFIFVLQDEEGKIFRGFVQSYDGTTYKVTTFGPAIDRTATGAASSKRPLDTWPAESLQEEAEKKGAAMVMIPYPYPMNQVYYQYGSEIGSARLVNVETGSSYQGLNELLNTIEADWARLK